MRRAVALVLACAAAAPCGRAQAGFQRAWELVGEGRFPAALEAARSEEDRAWRARAELVVRHHAGDLSGALAAGLAGLELEPRDPWLLEQTAYVAASLRRGELAAELAARLAERAKEGRLEAQEQARYTERAGELAAEAAGLRRAEEAREDALVAARGTVAAALVLALALLAWLAFSGRGRLAASE